MGREKYFKGKYYQGNLTDESANTILTLVNEYSEVASLYHCITDVCDSSIYEITQTAEAYEKENLSFKGYVYPKYEKGVGTVRKYQTIGIAFMYYAGSCLLGDEVGLGKTVQVAGLMNVLREEYKNNNKTFRCLFLTENTSIGQIRNKLVKFTGEFVGEIPSGERKDVDYYIEKNKDGQNYSVVGGHSLLGSSDFLVYCAKHPFDLVVLDEGAIVKNTSSGYHQSCDALFKYHDRKIILNATPLEMDSRELYNQLNLLDKSFLPTLKDFNKAFRTYKKTLYGLQPSGFKDAEVFREAISLRYLARTREGEGAQYEGNKAITINVPQSNEQKMLSKKTSLHQLVADFPTGVDRRIPCTPETTPKIQVVLSILKELTPFEDKLMIYCNYKQCQKYLKEFIDATGFRSVVLNGETKKKEKTEVIDAFNNGSYDVLITNAKRGIDLDDCDICVLYTIDPNPQKMVQAEGRITREFNIYNKTLYLLVSEGREKKKFETSLGLKVDASNSFTYTGKSMVLSEIVKNEKKKYDITTGKILSEGELKEDYN